MRRISRHIEALIGIFAVTIVALFLLLPYLAIPALWFIGSLSMANKIIGTVFLILAIFIMKPIKIIKTCHKAAIAQLR